MYVWNNSEGCEYKGKGLPQASEDINFAISRDNEALPFITFGRRQTKISLDMFQGFESQLESHLLFKILNVYYINRYK